MSTTFNAVNAKLLDYGVGNVHSVTRAFFAATGIRLQLESNVRACLDSDLVVLPGVGAFSHAAAVLEPNRQELRDALLDGLPCIGICLGMQLLFEQSEEGEGRGLGLIPGKVRKLTGACVPHMGWSEVSDSSDRMYFAHSYECIADDARIVRSVARFEEASLVASVRVARTVGLQFHPERSSAPGLAYLAACTREVLS